MLDMDTAKKVLHYFGFMSNTIEPILCKYKEEVGLFVTLKTKYGHLSRFLKFETKEKLESFLYVYAWYRKRIKNEFLTVVFDDYKVLSPKVTFYYKEKELDSSNIYTIEKEEEVVEELEIDTKRDENLSLLQILTTRIRNFYPELKKSVEDANNIVLSYKEAVKELNRLMKKNEAIKNVEANFIDTEAIENDVVNLLDMYINEKDESNFSKYFNDIFHLLEQTLLDSNYLDNLYLISFYQEKLKNVEEQIKKFKEYTSFYGKEKNKLFKKKMNSFADFLSENPVKENIISKDTIVSNKQTEVENSLIQLKNNSIEELKIIYGIKKKEVKKETVKVESTTLGEKDLKAYFMTLSKTQRNEALVLFSPIKELLNLINSMDIKQDILSTIYKEDYFLDKFKEVYLVISNQDNYVSTRKYLKYIKLDSLEEFIESILTFREKMSITPYVLPYDHEIKYKAGVLTKIGYTIASTLNEYPINNKGINYYCIATLKKNVPIYYSPYMISIDSENTIMANENVDKIIFDSENIKIENKEEKVVINYMSKKIANTENEFEFPVFNKKIYCIFDVYIGEKNE